MSVMTLQARNNRLWWLVLVRGIAAILFGFVAMFWPSATLSLLFMIFGAYAVLDGIVAFVTGLIFRGTMWGWVLVQGVVSFALGLLTFRYPEQAAALFVVFLAAWALVGGALQTYAAFRLRGAGEDNWVWVFASGALSLVFGIYFMVNPLSLAKFLLVITGVFAMLLGVVLVAGAFRVRALLKDPQFQMLSGGIL